MDRDSRNAGVCVIKVYTCVEVRHVRIYIPSLSGVVIANYCFKNRQ